MANRFDLDEQKFSVGRVRRLIDEFIPLNICYLYRLVPLYEVYVTLNPMIAIGMTDPNNLIAEDLLADILRRKGFGMQIRAIAPETFHKIISNYLTDHAEWQAKLDFEKAIDIKADLASIKEPTLIESRAPDQIDLGAIEKSAQEASIISLVEKVLAKALSIGASDIHIEPSEENLHIRFRKDGLLRQGMEPLPQKTIASCVARFKIIANLDIAERRLPQDGRLRRYFQERKVDFRVSTMPSIYGEKVVLRILNNAATPLELDKIIKDADCLQTLRRMIAAPHGLILVTGPTGSGKTTTLYSALAERNRPDINICTVEDPVENTLPGITQVQLTREKGLDFARALRSLLRQDPDIILVGEVRDRETAKTAIEASQTGHLVLTSLHTNDAASAIARLNEMGIEPYLIASTAIGVVAQRLVRRVCPTCRIPYTPTPAEVEQFNLSDGTFFKANLQTSKNQVCVKCQGFGYSGRLGVYEVMKIDGKLQKLIGDRAPTLELKRVAIAGGMKTMLDYSLTLVRQGQTTLEEVRRVVFTG